METTGWMIRVTKGSATMVDKNVDVLASAKDFFVYDLPNWLKPQQGMYEEFYVTDHRRVLASTKAFKINKSNDDIDKSQFITDLKTNYSDTEDNLEKLMNSNMKYGYSPNVSVETLVEKLLSLLDEGVLSEETIVDVHYCGVGYVEGEFKSFCFYVVNDGSGDKRMMKYTMDTSNNNYVKEASFVRNLGKFIKENTSNNKILDSIKLELAYNEIIGDDSA